MQNLKDKMYNYEVTPPSQSWQVIATSLDENKTANLRPFEKRSKVFYFSLGAVAALAIFVFSLIFWGDNPGKKTSETTVANSEKASNGAHESDNKITVPKTSEPASKKYITITSPQGECVKISSKAAMLIVSSDNQNPPKPVWNAKVDKWKDIMESNIFAPTTANFLDIVDLTHALRIDN